MAIQDDWSVDTVNRIIKYVGTGARYSVNELYSWLMDLFDNPEYMDDPVPMSARTPTDYQLINQWYITQESFKYLYGGAISTIGWDADSYDKGIVLIEFDPATYTPASDSDIGTRVSGSTTGEFGTLIDYDNANARWWVRVDKAGTYASAGETVTVPSGAGGTASSVKTGEWLWSNLYTLGSITSDALIYIYYGKYNFTQGYYPKGDEIEPFWLNWGTGHIDVLIPIKEAGSLIKNGYVTVFLRNYRETQDWFEIDLSGGGRNAVPLSNSTDISNQTTASTVRDYTDIKIAQVCGKLNVTGETGTFQAWETVTGQTSGATAIVLEYDPDRHYLILGQVEGTFQDGETIVGDTSGASATVSGTLDTSVTKIYKDLRNGAGKRPYDIAINCAGRTLAEVYEYLKYITSKPYYNVDYAFFYNANTGEYTDLSEAINESDTKDDVLLPPQQTTTEGDAIYIGSPDKFNKVVFYITTPGTYSDITIVWEYWNGSTWATLSVTDNTNGFTASGIKEVTFTPPSDWATTDVNGVTAYWIRARATFGASPSITTAPKGTQAWLDYGDRWYIIQNDGTTLYKTYGEVFKYAQTDYSPVKQCPFGQYLGGTFFGARGVWIENMDPSDIKNYQLIDSEGVTQKPPNIVTVKVTSCVEGDRVGVFRLTEAGGEIDKKRYQIAFTSVDYAFFYRADTGEYIDETTDINNDVVDDVYLPPQQTTTEGDAIYIGSDYKFSKIRFNVSTAGSYSDITIVWEYWNGSSWVELTVTDNTNGFTVSGTNEVSFTPPSDWAKTTVNGVSAYWIRARATFGASPSITTAPLGARAWLWFNYAGSNVVGVSPSIYSDEPESSTVRIVFPDGTEHIYEYESWTGDKFILKSGVTLSQDYTEGQYVYVPIIDKTVPSGQTEVYNTLVYSQDIPVIVRVRQKGYLPFEVETTITSVGLTVSAIRSVDYVVT